MIILKNEKGVTLIELLAAITLLMIVLIPFTTVFFQGFKANVENIEMLNTKMVATGIIDQIKDGVRQSKQTVILGDEVFNIANPNDYIVRNHPIRVDNNDYFLSFEIKRYLIPNSMLSNSITTIPTNLYKITVTVDSLNKKPTTLFLIVERK